MNVADVMTRGVISLAPDDSVQKAAKLMMQYEVSGFPGMDRGKLVGIVTEGDFLRRVETGTERRRTRWIEFLTGPGQLADEYAHAHGRKVGDVMTRDLVTVTEETSLEEVVGLMESHHIKRLPVVKGDALVGILSRGTLLHAPILVVPNNGTFSDVGKHALVGWDGSREAARAIRDAMRLLQAAERVSVVVIDPLRHTCMKERIPQSSSRFLAATALSPQPKKLPCRHTV